MQIDQDNEIMAFLAEANESKIFQIQIDDFMSISSKVINYSFNSFFAGLYPCFADFEYHFFASSMFFSTPLPST